MTHKNKTFLLFTTLATTAIVCAIGVANMTFAEAFPVRGDNSPYVLNLNRSVTSAELSAGQATFNTSGGNPINFNFDSEKASVDSGLISLATGGYFYNDTKITGISRLEISLSSGNAIVSYGNAKDALYVGKASLSGTSPITIDLSTPSDYFKISNVAGPLAIDSLKITYSCSNSYDPDIHEGAEEFVSSSAWADGEPNHYFVSPADSKVIDVTTDIIAFDVKFTSDSGTLNFYLNEYWSGRYCGPFALSTAGVLTGTGASLKAVDDNWCRITINLPATTKGGDPEFVSRVNLSGTTANGFIKYMGTVEPDIHEGAKEFTSSSAWADGTVNYYFVSPADSKVLDMSTDVITFDVKFTSDSGTLNFYLNEYWSGRYCGPFALSTTGVLTGSGASLSSVGDGWYRITIDLSATAKSATVPEYVSRINLVSTTAAGFIKYMGIVS